MTEKDTQLVAGLASDLNRELGMACQFCNTVFDGVNYHDAKTGHFEVVSTILNRDCDSEVWYCCHICRDNNEPCETFFPVSVIRCLTTELSSGNPQQFFKNRGISDANRNTEIGWVDIWLER